MVDEVEDMGLTVPEDVEEVMETVIEEVVAPTPVATPKLSGSIKEQLTALVGEEGVSTLEDVAKSTMKELDEFAKITVIDTALDSLEIFTGKNRSPLNMIALDAAGNTIDLDDAGIEFAEKGYEGFSVDSVFETTVFEPGFSPENIGEALKEVFRAKLTLGDWESLQKQHTELLDPVRKAMTQLGEVFGFDNYEHLEMFFAAWLMKDSTCRLSGIPGTGKTTVIESAAVLLCNSYGFNKQSRFVAPIRAEPYTMDELFGDKRAYVAQEYPSGMEYNLKYSNAAYETVRNDWDEWRFTSWTRPGGRNRSGAYMYDLAFLHPSGKRDGEPFQKKALEIENFYKLLNNCYVVQAPVQGFTDPSTGKAEGRELLAMLDEDQIQTVVAPIKLLNADGTVADFGTPLVYEVFDVRGNKHEFPMQIRFPDVNMADETENTQNYKWILEQGDATEFIQDGYGLFTDAGRSEGFGFRQYLIENFVDLRSKDARITGRWKPILEEMLEEIGVAKIDYEKRADEVLYGIEIQQSTVTDKIRDAQISTYEFEPVPRPIVTQPIKFFNEANRSQAGVEDAVLGLIAERKVEYRGKSFDSPNFVAWMDTNPHQKGNDLAFIDRIDMELLFKSISLGERYSQLSGRYGGGVGLAPQEQIVAKLAAGGDIGFTALRFGNLSKLWSFVGKQVGFAPPGQQPGTSTYDALREISYISVLFTQRFMPRNTQLRSGTTPFNVTAETDFNESPLMDFSVTTNTNEEGKSNINLPSDIRGTYSDHTPSNIDRVLGFRFTNSLVKLSSALAFLRGKSYVTRQEILDGLPYVTAHRLGRAKSSKGEIQGLPATLQFNNEQEWIREAIVNGYLLQETNIGFSQGGLPLMDIWDLYYRRCVDALKSAPALFWYEQQVLIPLHQALIQAGSDVGNKFTPVHWHIATMVVQNEKSATMQSLTKPYRTYAHGDDYQSNYNYYLTRVFSNPNPTKSTADQALFDYYELRGEICSEPNLFSDDRETLLELLASTMDTISGQGAPGGKGSGVANPSAVVANKKLAAKAATNAARYTDTTSFPWRTYQDSIGTWGRMLQLAGTDGISAGADVFTAAQTSQSQRVAASFADQALMISGRMEVKEPSKRASVAGSASSMQRDQMITQLNKVEMAFASYLGEGVQIQSAADGTVETMTFNQLMSACREFVTQYPARKDINDGKFTVGDMTVDLQGEGLMACFPLAHTAGAPMSTEYTGDDSLRLWIRLFESGLSGKKSVTQSGGSSFVTLNFTMGITSNWATKKGDFLNVVPVNDDDRKAYVIDTYNGTDLQDSGNLSKTDLLNYQFMFAESIKEDTAY